MIGVFATVGAGTGSAAAQGVDYRSASVAPASWRTFARQLQSRFQQRLAADDDAARSFQDYMAKREGDNTSGLVVRSWILPDGKIERVEFEGLHDDGVAVNLRALLVTMIVDAPPPDMLQPLHLRLSPGSKNPAAQGE